jgi:hypothetical protein
MDWLANDQTGHGDGRETRYILWLEVANAGGVSSPHSQHSSLAAAKIPWPGCETPIIDQVYALLINRE